MKPLRYSTVSDFHKCPAYYKHKHIDGLSDGIEKSADVAFGSAVHLGVQDLLEGSDGFEVFDMFWDMADKSLEYTRLSHADLKKMGRIFLEIFRDEQMKHFKPFKLEEKIIGIVGQHAFSGTVDFIGEYRGVPSIVDWKTSAMPYDAYKIIYNEQTYGYAHLVLSSGLYKPVQALYGVFIKDPKNPRFQVPKPAPLTKEKLDSVLANLGTVCDTITGTKVFYKNPTMCKVGQRVCPFWGSCYGEKK